MPILSPNHAPRRRPSNRTRHAVKSTGTNRFHVFKELENSTKQFKIIERNYWAENTFNVAAAAEKFVRLIQKSLIFKIDFLEDEVIVIPTRRGSGGMKDLRALLEKIEFHPMDDSDDKIYLALMKNFYEQFLEWARTYKNEPPPGFVPQFNRGRVNILKREPGRHKYGS